MWNRIFAGVALFLTAGALTCRDSDSSASAGTLSIAFYNLDNLFDTLDDTSHHDDDFTPGGRYKWTDDRYKRKLANMEKVIAGLAGGHAPDILGVCELESRKALEDLLSTGKLDRHYGIVHYDSPDERGIDVALAYNASRLSLIDSKPYRVKLSKDPRDKTRDILWVKILSKTSGDTLQLMVCHFPSRREGKAETQQDRVDAASQCRAILREQCNPVSQNLVIMGDFNDEPVDHSVSGILGAGKEMSDTLINLMWPFREQGRGSYKFRGRMEMLDQFIISRALVDKKGAEYVDESVDILDAAWLTQTGKYKGYPLRTFGGNKWLNGYSDHYPVFMNIRLNSL